MSSHVRICPSILTVPHAQIENELVKVAPVADYLHLDVMDGMFVPSMTFSIDASAKLIKESPLPVDAHLMVADGDMAGPLYAEMGCKSVTVHVEATKNIELTIKTIQKLGARASLAIKPGTSIDDYAAYLHLVDMILIMTVEPGAGGQKFMDEMLSKVARAKEYIGSRDIWLQVDGGVSLETIERAAAAGADTFVAGSAVFSAPDPAQMVTSLRNLATSVAG